MSGGVPGSRSPSVSNLPEANPLKVSIALGQGKQPAIIQKGPFYLMKPDPIVVSEVTGATNLMQSKNLEHSYTKLASKKMKDNLSSFLPGLPGVIDTPGTQVTKSPYILICFWSSRAIFKFSFPNSSVVNIAG